MAEIQKLKLSFTKNPCRTRNKYWSQCNYNLRNYDWCLCVNCGAGAVVTKNVPDRALMVGDPARIAGWMNEVRTKMKKIASEQYMNSEGKLWRVVNQELVKLLISLSSISNPCIPRYAKKCKKHLQAFMIAIGMFWDKV